MEAKLVVVGGEAKAGEYTLTLPTIIGRSRSADLTLANPLVSRQHCEVFESEGVLMVRDLGSLNGTFVGEMRIAEESALEPGDLLTVGATTFQAVYSGHAGEASAVGDEPLDQPVDGSASTVRAAAEIQQTMQADGLSALEQSRQVHEEAAAEFGANEETEPQDLDMQWFDEPTNEEGVAEEVVEIVDEPLADAEEVSLEPTFDEPLADAPLEAEAFDEAPLEDATLKEPAEEEVEVLDDEVLDDEVLEEIEIIEDLDTTPAEVIEEGSEPNSEPQPKGKKEAPTPHEVQTSGQADDLDDFFKSLD